MSTLTNRTRVTAHEINRIAHKIAEQFHPEKIILFGSYAYGQPTADSDVDLLIVMDTALRSRQQRLMISRALSPHPFPMDLVVKTPGELSERLALGDYFLQQITAQGKVLYAQPNPTRL